MKAFRAKKARPKKLTQVKKSRSWLRYRFFINFNLVVSSSGHMVLEDCSAYLGAINLESVSKCNPLRLLMMR